MIQKGAKCCLLPVAALLALFWTSCGDDTASGGTVMLSLNEVMPSNVSTIADEADELDDWLELYNGEDDAIDLGGWYLSDDDDDPLKAQLPQGLLVPGHGVLLIWADHDLDQGDDHVDFRLDKEGEVIILSDPDGVLVDRLAYQNASDDQSFARIPDGTGEFVICWQPTPGTLNGAACGGD